MAYLQLKRLHCDHYGSVFLRRRVVVAVLIVDEQPPVVPSAAQPPLDRLRPLL